MIYRKNHIFQTNFDQFRPVAGGIRCQRRLNRSNKASILRNLRAALCYSISLGIITDPPINSLLWVEGIASC